MKKKALNNLLLKLEDINQNFEPEEIQTIIYSVGKENGYEKNLRDWFKLIYQVLFGGRKWTKNGFFCKFFGLKRNNKFN